MKLTPDDVRVMRQIHATETNRRALIKLLAHEFGVSHWYAKQVVSGKART